MFRYKTRFIQYTLIGSICFAFAGLVQADLKGVWRTEPSKKGGYGDIQIFQCGESYCGRVVRTYGSASFLKPGEVIIRGLKREGNAYVDGQVYAAKFDVWLDMEAAQTSKKAASAKACYGEICMSQGWKRLR